MVSRLCLLSDSDVGKIAAFDITRSMDLYDPRFGNAGNSDLLCPTCCMRSDVCMGHHASLSLGLHIFHPLMYKESQRIINSTCHRCGSREFEVSKSRAKKCHECGKVNPGDYVVYANDISVAVRQSEGSCNKMHAHGVLNDILPPGHVISRILVPPIYLRTQEDMEWPTEIQRLYEQLIAAVRKKPISGPDVSAAYCKILGAHKKEGVTGVMSGKNGVFRQLMMGKRVELSARAVIVGDPSLELDQVAIPKAVADSVKTRTTCAKYNVRDLKAMASSGRLWWPDTGDAVDPANVLEGMAFDRNIKDGDLTMLNRQPSLSRVSIMCFRVVIRGDKHNVFAINPQTTPPFNADFDGDEMNTFFMEEKAEMLVLCHMSECDNGLLPVQDVVTGCYLMSAHDAPVSNSMWDDCIMLAGLSPDGSYLGQHSLTDHKTTFGLLSMCIPGYDGRRLRKRDMANLKPFNTHALQLVVERWLSVHGLTVPLKSIAVSPINRYGGESSDRFRERCMKTASKAMSGTGIMNMIESGAKGSLVHASHMAVAIGQQYIGGKEGIFCERPYSRGLTPDEFFGHQMAAREGVVSTGVGTASTGYLNRRACKMIADLKLQYNGTVGDDNIISSFHTY
jgi:DNA-directed RNA polymerase beta' subunit